MIDLKLPEHRIKEFKCQLKEGKIAIIKLFDGVLDDIDIEYTYNDNKKPVEELTEAVEKCKKDKTTIDEHKDVKEKKNCNSSKKFSKVDFERCKELINALDSVPYKVMEKIGELRTNGNGEGFFITEPDPYVVNDERELPKIAKGLKEMREKYNTNQSVFSQNKLNEDEKTTLEASKEKEWKDSMKNDIIAKPMIVTANLDKKYEDMTTGEKRQISKKLIEKDAKEDSDVIKERVKKAIGTNEPLSDELINAPEQRTYNEVPWTNKNMEKPIGKVPDDIKKVWEDDREIYSSLKNSFEEQWKIGTEKEKELEENGE